MCSFYDVPCLQRPCPPIILIRHDFNCHINERQTLKTCLTNDKGSISHHITPLGINSLGGGHAHTHTHKHTHIADKSNFKKPGAPAFSCRGPGLINSKIPEGIAIISSESCVNQFKDYQVIIMIRKLQTDG